MVKYGLTIENQYLICQKAKTKEDGCYRFRGVAYRVKDGRATHFGFDGQILESFGNFNVVVGTYDYHMSSDVEAQKALKKIDT